MNVNDPIKKGIVNVRTWIAELKILREERKEKTLLQSGVEGGLQRKQGKTEGKGQSEGQPTGETPS